MYIRPVPVLIVVVAIAFVMVISAAGRYMNARIAIEEAATANVLRSLQITSLRTSHLENQVGLLVADNKTVQEQLAQETQKRVAAEQEQVAQQAQAQQQINKLTKELDAAKSPDIAALVQNWRLRIALIGCSFDLPNGSTVQGQGSGVLLSSSPTYTLTTNRHVVVHQGVTADFCIIKFPGDTETTLVNTEAIRPSPNGEDWATVDFKPSTVVASRKLSSAPRCTRKASAGESILILGYPTIGSRDDVTATEGIVSGFENNYYITSAKVERGNSGGAALLSKEGCYLGAPTYVGAGQVETLARILDQSVIGK